jgi:hypothetical protein
MVATKIDGTAIAKQIRERLRAEIGQIKETNPRFRPSLKIIQGSFVLPETRVLSVCANCGFAVGDRSDSCKLPRHEFPIPNR